MRHMRNEQGLSLVELLATFVIMGMIGLLAYGVMFNGFKTYERVKIEANLRDEADLIMAELISEIFLLKESEIAKKQLPELNTSNYYIETEDGKKYGFINGNLVLDGVKQNVLNNNLISLTNNTKITEVEDGQYRIIISLMWVDNGQTLETESEIGTIKDKD